MDPLGADPAALPNFYAAALARPRGVKHRAAAWMADNKPCAGCGDAGAGAASSAPAPLHMAERWFGSVRPTATAVRIRLRPSRSSARVEVLTASFAERPPPHATRAGPGFGRTRSWARKTSG